jgi:hypothetical protein
MPRPVSTTYDLCVLDFDTRPSRAEVIASYKALRVPALEGATPVNDVDPSRRVEAFLADCSKRWPDRVNDDPTTSPWAFWPNHLRRTANGLLARIIWGDADPMRAAWIELAEHHGLVFYDPQGDNLVRPTRLEPAPPTVSQAGGWFARRRRSQ